MLKTQCCQSSFPQGPPLISQCGNAEAQLGCRRLHEQMRIVQEGLQKEDLLNAA
jgi:hypothetical protein